LKSIITIALLAISCFAVGQEAKISLDRSAMRIGEQTVLHLYFTYQNPNGTALIVWPNYEGNLTDEIEIVKKSIDQEILIDSATSTFQREQNLVITVFEEGDYAIPAQEIKMGDSTYYTNSLDLMIETVEVDTSKGITDIKPIYTLDYPLSERASDWVKSNWNWIILVLALILGFFIWRYFWKKPVEEVEEEEEIIPAHILALDALKKLLAEEGWKNKEKKLYYSELTDTIRTYLENRFSIHAMEKTTREIISELKSASISESDKEYLKMILKEADMVKFAKFTPSEDDAFAYLNKSIDFVNRTKEIEKVKDGN
jgi:hypothetical protein